MSWLDHQENLKTISTVEEENKSDYINIHMPGAPEGVFVPIGHDQIKKKYSDEVGPRLIIIVDEMAELIMRSGNKGSEAAKEEDALKSEIEMIITSITQLGRSSGVECILCTQRSDAKVIPGMVKNNSLALDTKLQVKRLL